MGISLQVYSKMFLKRTGSIATTISNKQLIKLIVNPNYWDNDLKIDGNEQGTKNLRYGAIKHQILHIVFKHALRFQEFGNKKTLWNRLRFGRKSVCTIRPTDRRCHSYGRLPRF